MSVESAKAFIAKLESDADLRSKVEGAADDSAKRAVAKAAGFDFTREEMKTAVGSHSTKGELSEDQLTAVAGGSTPDWINAGATAVGAAAAAA